MLPSWNIFCQVSPLKPQQHCADTAEAPWTPVFMLSVCLVLDHKFDKPWTGLCVWLWMWMKQDEEDHQSYFCCHFSWDCCWPCLWLLLCRRGVEDLGVEHPACCFPSSSSTWIWCLCVCQTASKAILSEWSDLSRVPKEAVFALR